MIKPCLVRFGYFIFYDFRFFSFHFCCVLALRCNRTVMLLFMQSSLCCLLFIADSSSHPSIFSLCMLELLSFVHHSSPQTLVVLLFLLRSAFVFGTHPKRSVHVFSDFPSFLCFCLFSPPALQKMVRKVRGSRPISLLFCYLPPMPVVFLSSLSTITFPSVLLCSSVL